MSIVEPSPGNFIRMLGKNYELFIGGMPIGLPIISVSLFLLAPSAENFMLFIGSFLTFLVGIFSSGLELNSMNETGISIHGLALGYYAGFIAMNFIEDDALIKMLSTLVFVCIFSIILNQTSNLSLLYISGGLLIGLLFGLMFGYLTASRRKHNSIHGNKDDDVDDGDDRLRS